MESGRLFPSREGMIIPSSRWAHIWMLAWLVAIVPINICSMSYVLFSLPDESVQAAVRAQDDFNGRSFGEQHFQVEEAAHKYRARWLWFYLVSFPASCIVWCFITVLFVEKSLEKKQLLGYLIAFSLATGLLTFVNFVVYLGFTFFDF